MRPNIYLFGDSITEESFGDGGWGSNLAQHFSRTVDVLLRGNDGYNTRWALKMKDKVFLTPPANGVGPPLAVVVFFGANDASLPEGCNGFQHVPLDEFKQNLLSIVAFLRKNWASTSILLITPPPVDEAARLRAENHSGVPERTNEAAGRYAKECLNVGAAFGVSVIDLWTKMQQFPGWQKAYLRDGFHLTPKGNKLVSEEVIEWLKEKGVSLETLVGDSLKSFDN